MSRNVRKSWAVAAGCLGVIGAASGVLGITPDQPEATGEANPYVVIVSRNVFRLNPPPPPPDPMADVKPAELPEYKLTGIANISGEMRVFFALQPKDAKEPPTYLNLAPGERQGQLELVSIDRDKEEVAVINSGTAMTLSVKNNSMVASSGAAPAAPAAPGGKRLPGFPAPPAPGAPPPTVPAPAAAAGSSGGGVVVIGGGGGSGAQGGGSGNANYAQQNNAGNYASQGSSGFGGGGYGSGSYGSGGVSVAGASPVNYGGGGGAGVTIATPNGALNLGGTEPPGQTANWPPVQEASPVEQAAAILAASEGQGGLDNTSKAGASGSKVTGPPALPIK